MPDLTTLEDVKAWLTRGVDDPKTFTDMRWEVIYEESREGRLVGFRVSNEMVPVRLYVMDMEAMGSGVNAIRLVIETGVKTIDLDSSVKLRLYRSLLEGAKIPFAAFYLFGEEDEIGIAADLDKRGLTKEEFDAHLAVLFVGYSMLLEMEAIKDQLLKEQVATLLELVASWIQGGMGRDQVVARLVGGGLDRETAEKTVDAVLSAIGRGRGDRERLWI